MPTVKNSISKTRTTDKAVVNTIHINVDSAEEKRKRKERKKKKKLAKAYARGGYGGIRGRGRGGGVPNVQYPQYPQQQQPINNDAATKQIAETLQKQFDERYAAKENEKAKAKESPFQSPGAYNAVDNGRGYSLEKDMLSKPNDNFRRVTIEQPFYRNPINDELRQSFYQTEVEADPVSEAYNGPAINAKPLKEKQYCSICDSYAVDLKAHEKTKKHKKNLAKLNAQQPQQPEQTFNIIDDNNEVLGAPPPNIEPPKSLSKSKRFEEAMKDIEKTPKRGDILPSLDNIYLNTKLFDSPDFSTSPDLFTSFKRQSEVFNNHLDDYLMSATKGLELFDQKLAEGNHTQ